MKRCLYLAVLSVLLTSCVREPPAYVSTYVDPTTSSLTPPLLISPEPQTAPQPPQASFVDNFDRPNTVLGLGEGWDMRSDPVEITFPPPSLPAATDGFIKDGHFTYSGASPVYAVRQFRGTVRSMGTIGRFRSGGSAFIRTALSMSIIANDQLVTDMLIFAATRSGWSLKVRRANGAFVLVDKGNFSPILELDRTYQFELEATENTVTVKVPNSEVTMNVSTAGLLGDRASFQERPARTPAGDVFDFDTVWVAEDNQPLVPVSVVG